MHLFLMLVTFNETSWIALCYGCDGGARGPALRDGGAVCVLPEDQVQVGDPFSVG